MAYIMRTTIELPDEVLSRAKISAALKGISLRQFFVEAVESHLSPAKTKVRKTPPTIGSANAPRMKALTRKQVDEAMFS